LIRALAGALVLLGLAAASSGAQAQTLTIAGRVVADDTGTPLPHARVIIYNDATPLPSVFSDAEGRFSSSVPSNGRYRLAATKAGFVLTNVARLNTAGPAGVEVRMPRSASISGRVFDMYGEPVIRTAVTLEPIEQRNARAPLKVVVTDDFGEYRLGGLAPGSYLVAVTQLAVEPSGNLSRVRMFYPGAATPADATPVVLAAGDQKAGIDFSGVTTDSSFGDLGVQLAQQPNIRIGIAPPQPPQDTPQGTATIRGRVTRPDGLAVARARVLTNTVRAMGGGRTNVVSMSVTTDDDGRYEMTGLFAGNYRIRVTKPGFIDTFYEPPGAEGNPFGVADGQIKSQIDVVLPRQSAVAGQVFDDFSDPLEGATVSAWQIRFQSGRRTLVSVNAGSRVTDDLGRYRLSGFPPGQYLISTSIGQVGTATAVPDISGFATTYFPGTTNAGEARLVTVPRSQDVEGIDIALVPEPTANIVGRRVGVDGQPMGGSIMLTQSRRSGAIVTPSTGARTWDDGRFEFPNVSPGEYVVQASTGKPGNDREGEFAAQFVTVNGADVRDVLMQGTLGSTISGRVVFDGDPPTGAVLRNLSIEPTSADPDRSPSSGNIARADVRQDLTFSMQGIHGPRRITVPRPPTGWMLKSVTSAGVDVTDVALQFGTREQSLTDVEVALTNRLTELTGTAVDSRGQLPIAYTLLVFPTDHDRWYAGSRFFRRMASDSSGNFAVRGLPPGDYFVAAVSGMSVLRDGPDAWQDPEFLDSVALRAAHVTVTDGAKISTTFRLMTP
jgi:protocatechuate 3,4-dioxygenase beta subunit